MQLWAEIRRRVLAGELSLRQAAVDYDLNFRTIQKIVHQAEPQTQQHLGQPRPKPILGRFLPIIQQIVQDDLTAPPKQRHTARRIYERLRDEHHYTGCQSSVRVAVAQLKKAQ